MKGLLSITIGVLFLSNICFSQANCDTLFKKNYSSIKCKSNSLSFFQENDTLLDVKRTYKIDSNGIQGVLIETKISNLNDTLLVESYKNGLLNGSWKLRDESNPKTVIYNNGKGVIIDSLNGVKSYVKNNTFLVKEEFFCSQKNKEVKSIFYFDTVYKMTIKLCDSDNIFESYSMNGPFFDGKFIHYYEDSNIIKLIGFYVEIDNVSKREGVWEYFNIDGELLYKETYLNDILISE